MVEPVKAPRRYKSPRRREQAAATRRAILEAAQPLFERDGYGATTMEAIAADAGVALKTVYVAFETKSGLLRALWDLLLKGDQDEAPVGRAPWYLEVLEERDPERKLRLTPAHSRMVKQRVGELLHVIRDAAPLDADAGALWRRSRPTSTRTSARSSRRCDESGRSRRGSTPTAPPTSCGRSTTPTCGCSWSASAAGGPSRSSSGSATR